MIYLCQRLSWELLVATFLGGNFPSQMLAETSTPTWEPGLLKSRGR